MKLTKQELIEMIEEVVKEALAEKEEPKAIEVEETEIITEPEKVEEVKQEIKEEVKLTDAERNKMIILKLVKEFAYTDESDDELICASKYMDGIAYGISNEVNGDIVDQLCAYVNGSDVFTDVYFTDKEEFAQVCERMNKAFDEAQADLEKATAEVKAELE